MTGRRSIATWDARLSRAEQFVPGHVGGRVDSAQPIRRNGGTLRQASVGATTVEGVTTVYGGWDSGQTIDPSEYGNLIWVYVHSIVEPTTVAPSGWTVVDSGSVGSALWWALMWAIGSASLDCDIESGWTSGVPGNVDAYSRGYLLANPGTLRPHVANTVTATGATSITLPTGPASLLPSQVGSYVPDVSAPVTFGWSPADTYSSFAITSLSGSDVVHSMFGADPKFIGDPSDAGPFPSGSSRTASASGTWSAHAVYLA